MKKISFRISEEDYNIMYADYLRLKKNPEWAKFIYSEYIDSFSHYIRLMIVKAMND